MTQENELLLKDLCTRLPYGVYIKIEGYGTHKLTGIDGTNISTDRGINYPLHLVKPYLITSFFCIFLCCVYADSIM